MACKPVKTDSASEKNQQNRPNILYIMADDLTIQAISAYKGIYQELAPTPNIDRIAQEGMLFYNVLSTNAICGPSRASILTGNYSNVHGYYKNESGGKFNADLWTFPQEFQKNGYKTALFGKWHLGSKPKGFDTYAYHNAVVQQGTYWNPVYNENGENRIEKGYATNLTTEFALDWMENVKTDNQPFLLMLQYKAPHRPWRRDTVYSSLWENQDFPYPASFNDSYKGRELTAGDTEMTLDYLTRNDLKLTPPPDLEGESLRVWKLYGLRSSEVVKPDSLNVEEGKRWRYQTYIKDYLACVKSVDDNIGKVLNYLEENQLQDNTIVILTSDQGFYLGDHGFFDKRFIYDESIKMPFMVRYPEKIQQGSVNKMLIANIDIAETLLDLADIQNYPDTQGESFAPILFGKDLSQWKESVYYHYYEFPYWHHVQPHYGIRTQKYTLAHFYYNMDQWELYDLDKDPNQLHNVANDPAYNEVMERLTKRLKKDMIHYQDYQSLTNFKTITDTDFGAITKEKN
ncbi:MAG: sulfatase [Christiangramia sp.]|uniref:sulfatase family protein n=1 Tax=Christiangramia sp. TaxID=1931228 RepID=UPI00214F7946|nr:sulfatase [Christiangramia flava]